MGKSHCPFWLLTFCKTVSPYGIYQYIVHSIYLLDQCSGGKGHFKVYDNNEPVEAICQGCTGGDVEIPATTTIMTSTDKSTTTSGNSPTVTTPPDQTCCEALTLTSSGGVQEHYGEALGEYLMESMDSEGICSAHWSSSLGRG